jgi:hypothetical protein
VVLYRGPSNLPLSDIASAQVEASSRDFRSLPSHLCISRDLRWNRFVRPLDRNDFHVMIDCESLLSAMLGGNGRILRNKLAVLNAQFAMLANYNKLLLNIKEPGAPQR